MLQFTTDQWIIVALVFFLGFLVGGFIFAGGGRKWKHRYRNEQERREQLELNVAEREKEWRERDSLREAALKDRKITQSPADDPVV
jgi:C4-dicarboxylate-specific signal transduction histidine kinase